MQWVSASSAWYGRWVFERGLAITYLIAYLVTINQFPALLGERGLLPAPRYMQLAGPKRAPSLFHLRYSDRLLKTVGWAGVALSASLIVGLPQRGPVGVSLVVWLLLWVGYLSVVNIGQRFYSFGWESLLLEVGFLALFLGNAATAAPLAIMFLLRWVLFRLEFGAGLIKLRGDACWRDLTCLYYHHETQPMPNPLSRWFHHLPKPLHRVEVVGNHVAQLIVPWFLFAPEPVATVAALIIVITQGWLMLSGNFSWLNFVTIVLALSAVQGSLWSRVLPSQLPASPPAAPAWHRGLVVMVTALVIVLSWWPVRNMLSKGQKMNASFNQLHLVNTYGAFGSITRVRHEIIIEGTDDPHPGRDTEWRAYEFKGKPGDPRRRAAQFAPYHLRLDWLMWFAALSPGYAEGWFNAFVGKLLEGDRVTLRLLAGNPFPDRPPAMVRARLYRYRFTTAEERRQDGAWWHRELIGDFLPPVRLPG